MVTVGFVLLTHSNPDQILTLVRALNDLYNAPQIVCHHDFGQCSLDKGRFPENVRFVEPHFSTFWGCFAIVPAAMAGIRMLMHGKNPPDWFYLLSGSDYPSAPPENVLGMLANTSFDAFIDHREITYAGTQAKTAEDDNVGFARLSYVSLAYRRYCAVAIARPSREKPFAFPPVGHWYLYHPIWRSLVPGPFSSRFRCYAGEHWFTANGKAAEAILSTTVHSQRLLSHLRKRESPEECFYHSLLGNARLNLSSNNLRYIHWPSSDAWHPSLLSPAHLPAIRDSKAHFARKVAHLSPLVTELDRLCGLQRFSAVDVG